MLADFYPPVVGGLETHVALLSKEFAMRGHTITVATVSYREEPTFEERDGVRIYRLNGLFQRVPSIYKSRDKRYHPPVSDPLIQRAITTLSSHSDIVHAHGWILYSALRAKKESMVPLVATLHDYGLICPRRTLLTSADKICEESGTLRCITCARNMYGLTKSSFSCYGVVSGRRMLRMVNKYVAVSTAVKTAHVRHLNLEPSLIDVIPNFYSAREAHMPVKQLTMTRRELPEDFVLFVGVLAPYKGVDVLLASWRRLPTKTKLVLLGMRFPGFSYPSSNNIIVFENAPDALVKEAYSKCRFTVIPSIWHEPCPTVAFEAMAFRKSIIASDVGGLTDIVQNNETGLLFHRNDAVSLTVAIRHLLERPDIAHEMGERGFTRLVDHFSIDKVAPQIEALYKNVLDSAG